MNIWPTNGHLSLLGNIHKEFQGDALDSSLNILHVFTNGQHSSDAIPYQLCYKG